MSNKPKKPLTIKHFMALYPDDDAVLDHIMRVRYGDRFECHKCQREAHYYRVKGRRCYECEHCGYQVYPTADTPFHGSRTSLRDWFYAMFLFTASRNGVSAKEIQRQLGVTYKTAWRMCFHIRKHMAFVDGDTPLGGPGAGIVEVDKTFIGGKDPIDAQDKAVVLGMTERGGEVITRVVKSKGEFHVIPELKKYVRHGSRVATDKARAFWKLPEEGYTHGWVNHAVGEYVKGDIHTNTIEAFWGCVKRSIKGTYVWVSQKHLPSYLAECEYRWNLRKEPRLMFAFLVSAFATPKPRASTLRAN
jgi:transposase-like protein